MTSPALPSRPANPRPPTARQLEVLRFVATFADEHGYGPTFRELSAMSGGTSTNAVNDVLRALERRGLIERTSMKTRALVITEAGRRLLGNEAPPANVVRENAVLRAENARLRAVIERLDQQLNTIRVDLVSWRLGADR